MNNARRLSKLDMLISFIKALRNLLPIIILVSIKMKDWNSTKTIGAFVILALITIAVGVTCYLEWRKFQYSLQQDRLIIRKGIFKREEKTIYYNRIHSVNVQQPLLLRIFGAASLQIETPGGQPGKAEGELRVLKHAYALELQQQLKQLRMTKPVQASDPQGQATGVSAGVPQGQATGVSASDPQGQATGVSATGPRGQTTGVSAGGQQGQATGGSATGPQGHAVAAGNGAQAGYGDMLGQDVHTGQYEASTNAAQAGSEGNDVKKLAEHAERVSINRTTYDEPGGRLHQLTQGEQGDKLSSAEQGNGLAKVEQRDGLLTGGRADMLSNGEQRERLLTGERADMLPSGDQGDRLPNGEQRERQPYAKPAGNGLFAASEHAQDVNPANSSNQFAAQQPSFAEEYQYQYRLSFAQLLKASLTSLNLNFAFIFIFGIYSFADEVLDVISPGLYDRVFDQVIDQTSGLPIILLLLLSLLVIGGVWLLSVAIYLIKFGDYQITRSHMQLSVSYGLLEKKSYIFDQNKVQAVIMEENPLRQWLGFAELRVQVVTSNKLEQLVIHPFARKKDIPLIMSELLPDYRLELRQTLNAPPRAAFRNYALWPTIIGLLPVAGAVWLWQWSGLFLLLLLPIIWAWSLFSMKSSGVWLEGNDLTLRKRNINLTTYFVRRKHIVTLRLKSSPMQRKRALHNIHVQVLGSALSYAVKGIEDKYLLSIWSWYSRNGKRKSIEQ